MYCLGNYKLDSTAEKTGCRSIGKFAWSISACSTWGRRSSTGRRPRDPRSYFPPRLYNTCISDEQKVGFAGYLVSFGSDYIRSGQTLCQISGCPYYFFSFVFTLHDIKPLTKKKVDNGHVTGYLALLLGRMVSGPARYLIGYPVCLFVNTIHDI